MAGIFITGVGTDVGKTFVTCALLGELRAKFDVGVTKPIVTGFSGQTDTHVLLKAARILATEENIQNCSPWRFAAALSPDMAAKLEEREISFEQVVEFCARAAASADYSLIEAAGGVMTPINQNKTFRDLALALQLPTILVTGTYLGSISHCLTALECLRGLEVGVVICESENSEVGMAETASVIANHSQAQIITVPRCESFVDAPDLTGFLRSLGC